MNKELIFEFYVKQTQNVKALESSLKLINQEINSHIRLNDISSLKIKTKLFSLIYSTWSEAQFVQIIHTPDGFTSSEIEHLKKYRNKNGLDQAWGKLIDISFSRVENAIKSNDLPNRKQYIKTAITLYVANPATTRNKIAHGEWVYPFNSTGTALNDELKIKIENLCPVEIYKCYQVHRLLGEVIRELVQSPKKGFHAKYWVKYTHIEQQVDKMKDWSLDSKKEQLIKKTVSLKKSSP